MGLGPLPVHGDEDVCIIYGPKTPFVVHRDGPEGDLLCGDCYVHGLVDCCMQESDKDKKLYIY